MWHRIRRWFTLGLALLAIGTLASEEAGARGGGRGGGGRGRGPGGGRRGPSSGRGGVGGPTAGGTRAGRAGNKGGGEDNPAKEWEYLREQEERLAMIKARRERLMDLDRKKEQEAFLAAQRQAAVDLHGRADGGR